MIHHDDRLAALLQNMEDTLHVAHHVQETYFSAPSRPFHNPNREQAAYNIVKLAKAFARAGFHTHATALVDKSDFMTVHEAGLHPELCEIATTQHCGYAASAFKDGSIGFDGRPEEAGGKYKTIILTGYNTSQCFLETGLDALAAGFNLVVPVDATDNYSTAHDKNEALARLEDKGAILCSASTIIGIIEQKAHLAVA